MPDRPFLVNAPRHDANLRLPRRNHSRAIRPDQPRLRVLQHAPTPSPCRCIGIPSVMQTISGTPASSASRMRIGSRRRRHKNHRHIRARLLHRLFHGVENRPAFMRRSALARRHAAHTLRPVLRAALRVKRSFASGNPLHDQASILIDQNRHYFAPFRRCHYHIRCILHRCPRP